MRIATSTTKEYVKRMGNTDAEAKPSLLRRTLRFGITGVFITGLHVVIATVLIHFAQSDPSLANGVAFCCATIVSFLMHTLWSFSAQLQGHTLIKFNVVSIVGFLLSIGIPVAVQALGFGGLISTLAVVLVIPPVNFVLHNFWTYK